MLTTERLSKYINRLGGAITFVFEGWNIQNGAIVHPIKMYIARGDGVLFVTANRNISPPVLEVLMPGELINFTEVPTL